MKYKFTCQFKDQTSSAQVIVTDNVYSAAKEYAKLNHNSSSQHMEDKFVVTVTFDQAEHEEVYQPDIVTADFVMELNFECYRKTFSESVIDN